MAYSDGGFALGCFGRAAPTWYCYSHASLLPEPLPTWDLVMQFLRWMHDINKPRITGCSMAMVYDMDEGDQAYGSRYC